ncbi:hypothetical protein DSCW_24470 [Desulfosarcina widdelii]|uniref:Haem-binding uptake Tiki superfamily ChaN domain-containing protein n=2 Tax=Desulfosarcina widdelii TaxID=947919 RepID=A0A5K7Z306_9BACT|nr:hypothetical protein DSCW_24470 [Desulfosarcina widdelii]
MKIEMPEKTTPLRHVVLFVAALAALFIGGCAVAPKTLTIKGNPTPMMENAILKTATGATISRRQLIDELAGFRVVYVGESHTNVSHHTIQLEVIRELRKKTPDLSIGMEMFDTTYQPVLDRWTAGELDEDEFLRQTHWYANWRFPFDLYRDILQYAKENQIRVIALNLPFHIPAKIRVGGIASLGEQDAKYLPASIDTTNTEHRTYLEKIYKLHAFRGRDNFEFFYEAQCAWEDAMAAKVDEYLGAGKIVVLAGNGHIIRKFGIPDRAFARTRAPFATIYLAAVGSEAEPSWADYIWVTPDQPMPRMPMMPKGMKKPK